MDNEYIIGILKIVTFMILGGLLLGICIGFIMQFI